MVEIGLYEKTRQDKNKYQMLPEFVHCVRLYQSSLIILGNVDSGMQKAHLCCFSSSFDLSSLIHQARVVISIFHENVSHFVDCRIFVHETVHALEVRVRTPLYLCVTGLHKLKCCSACVSVCCCWLLSP